MNSDPRFKGLATMSADDRMGMNIPVAVLAGTMGHGFVSVVRGAPFYHRLRKSLTLHLIPPPRVGFGGTKDGGPIVGHLRKIILFLALGLALAACGAPDPARLHTLIVVRHADRDPGVDALNATGIARAEAMVAALEGREVDGIRLPDRNRNRQTAAPLAEARGLEPVVMVADAGLGRALWREARGQTLIWIGNTGNISDIWEALNALGAPPTEYGTLAILTGPFAGPTAREDLPVPP